MTEPSAPDRIHIASRIKCHLHEAGTVNLDHKDKRGGQRLRVELRRGLSIGVWDASSIPPRPRHRRVGSRVPEGLSCCALPALTQPFSLDAPKQVMRPPRHQGPQQAGRRAFPRVVLPKSRVCTYCIMKIFTWLPHQISKDISGHLFEASDSVPMSLKAQRMYLRDS